MVARDLGNRVVVVADCGVAVLTFLFLSPPQYSRPSEKSNRFDFGWSCWWCQPIWLGDSHDGPRWNSLRRRVLQSTPGIPLWLSQYATYNDFYFWNVASQCVRGWTSLHFHFASPRWRWVQFSRKCRWAVETHPGSRTNLDLCDFHAFGSQWRKSGKFGCCRHVEEWQTSFQEKGTTSGTKKSGRVLNCCFVTGSIHYLYRGPYQPVFAAWLRV